LRGLFATSVLALLYLLHFDFWLWRRPEIVLGLPIELWYQLAYCVLVVVALVALLPRARGRTRSSHTTDSSLP
jgi:hypothetical protein